MFATLAVMILAASEPRIPGAAAAPASLPAGSNALYGYVGVPDVAAGYRQGFGLVELDGRISFNLLKVSFIGEVAVKFAAFTADRFRLAPLVDLGVEFNSGAYYFYPHNFGYVGLRPKIGAIATYQFSDIVTGVAQLEVPFSIALNVPGFQITPTVGAGAEFHLGERFSLLVAGIIGFDATRTPAYSTYYSVAWGARLGIGYRIF